jgi:ferredoxin--NADP+ reductase
MVRNAPLGTAGTRTQALPQARLVSRRDVTEELMVARLEPAEERFNFKPGQYCTLGRDGIERAYSIVSAPYEPEIEVFVELVPDGELTPRMWQLKLGDTMSIRPRAKGVFVRDAGMHHHFMVATVTGVAPYISMIRQYLHQGESGHTFYVLLGASYQDELTYDEELAAIAAAHPETVKFIPTVSRPGEERNASWGGEAGRVNNLVRKYLDFFGPSQDDTKVYACGHPGMIAAVKEEAVPQGWKFIEERFWKE